jgi:hypothetical protein
MVVMNREIGRQFVEVGLRNGASDTQEFLPDGSGRSRFRELGPVDSVLSSGGS